MCGHFPAQFFRSECKSSAAAPENFAAGANFDCFLREIRAAGGREAARKVAFPNG